MRAKRALQWTAPCVTALAAIAALPPTVQVPRVTPRLLSLGYSEKILPSRLSPANQPISLTIMIHIFTPMLAAAAVFVSSSCIQAQEVVESMSAPGLQQIFKEEGYSFEPDQDGDVIWKIEGVRALVMRSEGGNQIIFRLSFKNENTTLSKVNDWNRTKRFSRSYLDEDGDPVLQLDLELDGGITKARIADFLKTCRVSMAAWVNEVL